MDNISVFTQKDLFFNQETFLHIVKSQKNTSEYLGSIESFLACIKEPFYFNQQNVTF